MIDDIDDNLADLIDILKGMLECVVPSTSGWRKNHYRWIRTEYVEEAKRTEIHLTLLVNSACKTDRTRCYRSQQKMV